MSYKTINTNISSGILTILLALVCLPCFADNVPLPLMHIGKNTAPIIDGHLREAAWQSCAKALPFVKTDGKGVAKVQTEVSAYYDDDNLYLGFICDEPDISRLRTDRKTHDSPVWSDDCVELFLRHPDSKDIYHEIVFHIVVNSAGIVYDARNGNSAWQSDAVVATSKEKNAWIVEMALPWKSFSFIPQTEQAILMNFCRERKVQSELSAWSCPYGGFHNSRRFAPVIPDDKVIRITTLNVATPVPGANSAEITVELSKSEKAVLQVLDSTIAEFTGDGKKKTKTFFYPLGLAKDFVNFEMRSDNTTFWQSIVPVPLDPPCVIPALEKTISNVDDSLKVLPENSPAALKLLRLANAAHNETDKYKEKINDSLKKHIPLPLNQYKKMNISALNSLQRLDKALWPVWQKNNWLDLKRDELPENDLPDVSLLQYTTLVNEYQSANLIISNLRRDPMRLRVIASDLTWFAPKADVLGNNDFTDANEDSIPDGWQCSGKMKVGQDGVMFLDAGTSLVRDISLKNGTRYLIYFKVKMENGNNLKVSVINAGWKDDRGTTVSYADDGWHIVSKMITAPSGKTKLIANAGKSGSVQLRDLHIVPFSSVFTFNGTAPLLRVADWQELRGGGTRADPLLPVGVDGRLDIPSGESRQIWLTFRANDLPPGICYGKIELRPLATSENQHPLSKNVDIELRSVPLRLKTSPSFGVYNWDYAQNEAQVKDMYKHKVNVFLCGVPWPQFDKNGNVIAPTDFSEIDKTLRVKMRYAKKADGHIMFSYGVVRGFYISYEKKFGWKFMGGKWRKAFTYGVKSWLEHLRKIGLKYNEFYAQIWDEAMEDRLDYVVKGGTLLRKIAPEVRWAMDGEQSVDLVKQMNPYIDLWIPVLHSLQDGEEGKKLLKYYKSTGKPIWTYTCQVRMKALMPYKYYRLKPWNAAGMGLQGVCYWAYNSWRGDSWNDFDSSRGDNGVVYEGADGGVVDSRRWEASREGIEDWQIIKLVQSLAKDLNPQIKKQAEIRVNNAIEAVLAEPDDFTKAQKASRSLIAYAVELAGKQPLTITDVRNTGDTQHISLKCRTNRPTEGKLFYRLKGHEDWQIISISRETEHTVNVSLPPASNIDKWILLLWDNSGRMAVAESKKK